MKNSKLIPAAAIALSAVLGIGAASAADMAVKAMPYVAPAPVLTWTGCYAGVNAGYHWSNSSVTTTATPGPFDVQTDFGADSDAAALSAHSSLKTKQDGFIGGGQIGCNWQWTPSWVVGVETDIQGLANNASSATAISSVTAVGFPDTFVTTTTVTKQVDWLGTLRGRIGFLASPNVLIYGTGGLAYGEAKTTVNISQAASNVFNLGPSTTYGSVGSVSEVRFGWTAGVGAEWKFAQGWSVKGEWLYYDLGSQNFALPQLSGFVTGCAVNPCWSANPRSWVNYTGNIARVGINYQFNGAYPVVARY